jgi:hypothetical protein
MFELPKRGNVGSWRLSRAGRRLTIAGGSAAAVLVVSAAVALAAGAATTTTTRGGGYPHVYQGSLGCCQNVVLGPQSNPTTIVTSPVLPAGTYLVNYQVGVNMEPADNVVCAAGAPAGGPGINGNYGSAGNGATNSGFGGGAGVYGSPNGVGTVTLKTASVLQVVCNDNNGGGTYVASASIVAQPIGTLTLYQQP